MSKDEFVGFVKALRDLGAVEVQAGEFRASFALPAPAQWDPTELFSEDPEEDHEAAAKARRAAWELAQYGSSG